MSRLIIDIEANGLLNQATESENATKIHCMCYYDIDTGKSESFYNESDIVDFFMNSGDNLTLVGHKIITYDIPLLEKLLGLDLSKDRKIDTLGLSWYLYPNRIKHGLEEWGEDLDIAKPPIVDWNNEPVEVYVHRCEQDVRINTKLFNMQLEYLKKIYNNDMAAIGRFMNYISFKLDCAREQEEVKVKIDVEKAKKNLEFLKSEKEKKASILSDIMPPSHTYKTISRPKIPFKKDGNVSVVGERWFALLKEKGLPDHHLGAIKVIDKTNKGNPNSHGQLKEWLFSLGWQPDVFKYVKDKTNEEVEGYKAMNKDTVRAVPQISTEDGMDLSDSVKDLFEVEPRLAELDSYFKINHRIGCIEAFLEKMNDKHFVKAEVAGLTNTLRFKHSKPIVNMPTSPKKYWEMVRGCIIAPDENHVLCGADMSSLESTTRNHYMHYFDPAYVEELQDPEFDSHTDIAVLSGLISKEEEKFFKWYGKQH